MMVQNLTEQHLDIVPDFRVDQLTEMQLLVTQRSFDCEQFVQRKAQKLCSDTELEFLYCEDYDIKIVNVSTYIHQDSYFLNLIDFFLFCARTKSADIQKTLYINNDKN